MGSGVHRRPEGQGRNGVTRAQSRTVGGVVPPRLGVSTMNNVGQLNKIAYLSRKDSGL